MKETIDTNGVQSVLESNKQNKETNCGPGCDCHAPASNNKTKITIGLVIALAVICIFAYKMLKAQPSQVNTTTSTVITNQNNTNTASPSIEQPKTPKVMTKQVPKIKQQKVTNVVTKQNSSKTVVGEYLESFQSLNRVAMNQDAVFILVPSKEKELVKQETETALQGVQRTLKTNGVNVGLYTLQTSAPEYQKIIQQISPPAIIVACKGRGMNVVPGGVDVTESNLLQAYVAGSRASAGCGPASSCGPSSGGCSDKRFKNNISPIETPLDKVLKLNGVTFTWDREKFPLRLFPDGRKIGLIAQEVESVIPEVVNTDNDGYKSVEYDKLVALLIEAVKEMKQQIQKQETVIQEQGKRINELEAAVK